MSKSDAESQLLWVLRVEQRLQDEELLGMFVSLPPVLVLKYLLNRLLRLVIEMEASLNLSGKLVAENHARHQAVSTLEPVLQLLLLHEVHIRAVGGRNLLFKLLSAIVVPLVCFFGIGVAARPGVRWKPEL